MHFCFLDPAFSIFEIKTWFRERKHVVGYVKHRKNVESEKISRFGLIVGVQNNAVKGCFCFLPIGLEIFQIFKSGQFCRVRGTKLDIFALTIM